MSRPWVPQRCAVSRRLVCRLPALAPAGVSRRTHPAAACPRQPPPQTLGYAQPNMRFVEGQIERLDEAGIADASVDLIISNCVVRPDKFLIQESNGNF